MDIVTLRNVIREELRAELARALSPPPALEFLSQVQAAEHCGVTTATIRNWHKRRGKSLPFTRHGKVVRYRRADLDAWMKGTPSAENVDDIAAQMFRKTGS